MSDKKITSTEKVILEYLRAEVEPRSNYEVGRACHDRCRPKGSQPAETEVFREVFSAHLEAYNRLVMARWAGPHLLALEDVGLVERMPDFRWRAK